MTTLHGKRVVLRAATEADVPGLVAILREPEVARWWGDRVEDDLHEALADEDTTLWVVLDGYLTRDVQ